MSEKNTSAWIALAAVCVLWGTTYLGIRLALESFGPFTLMGLRYFCSGAIMVAGAKIAKARFPAGRKLWLTALYGTLAIGMGTGLLCVAEEWVPSGLAALFIATQPFWMVLAEWAMSKGKKRPSAATFRGLLIGILGVAVLVAPAAIREGVSSGSVVGFLLLQLACAGWVTGALLQKNLGPVAHPIVNAAVQQFATGILFLVLASGFERMPQHVTARALGGMVYLVVFGAIIGYTAFVYAMDKLPATLVSIYTFVNPVVAVILGSIVFREPFGWRELIAMAFIFAGVAVVKFSGTRKRVEVMQEPTVVVGE